MQWTCMSWTGAALGHCTSQETSLIIQPFNSQRDKPVHCMWPVTPEKDHYRLPEYMQNRGDALLWNQRQEDSEHLITRTSAELTLNLVWNAERSVYVCRSNQRCIWGGRGGQLRLILYGQSWSMGTELTCKTWFKLNKLIIKLYIIWLNT